MNTWIRNSIFAVSLLVTVFLLPIQSLGADSISLDQLPPYPENGQRYWVIYKEGYRDSRIEMATCSVLDDSSGVWIVWNRELVLQGADADEEYNQYYLNDAGEWEQIGSYDKFTDYATEVLASNLDVWDVEETTRFVDAAEYTGTVNADVQEEISPILDLMDEQADEKVVSEEDACKLMERLLPKQSYVVEDVVTLSDSNCYTMQQTYEGIPVWKRQMKIVTDLDGTVLHVTGENADISKIDITPEIPQEQVEEKLFDYLEKTVELSSDNVTFGKRDLIIYQKEKSETLAYEYELFGITDDGAIFVQEFLLDANTGEIIWTANLMEGAMEPDTLIGTKRSYTAPVNKSDGVVYLGGMEVQTYHLKSDAYNWWGDYTVYDEEKGSFEQLTEPVWAATSGDFSKYDVDAYANTYRTLRYLEQFQSSITDKKISVVTCKGGIIIKVLDEEGNVIKVSNNDAVTVPMDDRFLICFTNNEDFFDRYSAYIDVVAHEMGHVLSRSVIDLDNTASETGAVGEGFSDVIGVCVRNGLDHSVLENPDSWIRSKPGWGDGRNLEDPHTKNYPDKYSEYNPEEEEHYNSTILSHAAYLMWEGTETENSAISSYDTMLELWTNSLMYWTPTVDLKGAAWAVLNAALDMRIDHQLTTAQYQGVVNSFVEVELIKEDTGKKLNERIQALDNTTKAETEETSSPSSETETTEAIEATEAAEATETTEAAETTVETEQVTEAPVVEQPKPVGEQPTFTIDNSDATVFTLDGDHTSITISYMGWTQTQEFDPQFYLEAYNYDVDGDGLEEIVLECENIGSTYAAARIVVYCVSPQMSKILYWIDEDTLAQQGYLYCTGTEITEEGVQIVTDQGNVPLRAFPVFDIEVE